MLATTLLCLVVGVSDGDTLTARCGEPGAYEQIKVRIAGIDAPERRQPYGERARQALAELTFQKSARLECVKTYRYKRSVCNMWVAPASAPNGPQTLDAGLAMVTVGMAGLIPESKRPRHAGLWADPEPVSPWRWRKAKREQRQ